MNKYEIKYSPTEKEALGLIWAVEKLHLYLYHADFDVIVDHQPLKFIFNTTGRSSPRIERWQMKLQGYSFHVTYKQGKRNIADFLSRIRNNTPTKENFKSNTNCHVNFVVKNAVPLSMSIEQIKQASEQDVEVQNIKNAILRNDWNKLPHFKNYAHEFSEVDGIIVRCNRIYIPHKLRQDVLQIVHRSHLGIVKAKSLLRSKVYWYGIDKDVENFLKSCSSCQQIANPEKPTPVKMSELPSKPWEYISADFYGPAPSGEKVLIITDLYSKFPIAELMKSTNFNTVSNRLDNLFSIFGYPEKIKTDNGPPWDGHEIDLFFKARNIKHRPSIPLWPRSNGQVERFMRNINKIIQHANASNTPWKESLRSLMLQYRNSIHSATNETPAKLFFNRETNFGLPSINKSINPAQDSAVRQHHQKYAEKAKQHADTKCNPQKHIFKEGDQVYVKRGQKQNKHQSNYFNDEYTVTNVNNSMITVKSNSTGQSYRRHVSFAKPIIKSHTQTSAHQNNKDTEQNTVTLKQYPLRSRASNRQNNNR